MEEGGLKRCKRRRKRLLETRRRRGRIRGGEMEKRGENMDERGNLETRDEKGRFRELETWRRGSEVRGGIWGGDFRDKKTIWTKERQIRGGIRYNFGG